MKELGRDLETVVKAFEANEAKVISLTSIAIETLSETEEKKG